MRVVLPVVPAITGEEGSRRSGRSRRALRGESGRCRFMLGCPSPEGGARQRSAAAAGPARDGSLTVVGRPAAVSHNDPPWNQIAVTDPNQFEIRFDPIRIDFIRGKEAPAPASPSTTRWVPPRL